MQPPATAAPLTKQMVGNGKTDILPTKPINSRMKYFLSSGSRLEVYLRSRPPLNSLERERVTRAVGPLCAST